MKMVTRRHLALVGILMTTTPTQAEDNTMRLEPEWEYVADTVMGGVSTGEVRDVLIAGRDAVQLTGDVSLENNGGFIQMAFDLAHGSTLDASGWAGIEMEVFGNGESYELRLRTDQLTRPWQSFRSAFEAGPEWQTIRIPWGEFEAHKTDAAFDPARLRRMGILAIGSKMRAGIALSSIQFYR